MLLRNFYLDSVSRCFPMYGDGRPGTPRPVVQPQCWGHLENLPS